MREQQQGSAEERRWGEPGWQGGGCSAQRPVFCAWLPCRYADLLINYLREATTTLLGRRAALRALQQLEGEGLAADLQSALTDPAAEDPAASCWGGTWDEAAHNCSVAGGMGRDYSVRSNFQGIKPPFFRDNEWEEAGVCAIGSDFEGLVSRHEGWQWLDEGRPNKPKLGYVSEQVRRGGAGRAKRRCARPSRFPHWRSLHRSRASRWC